MPGQEDRYSYKMTGWDDPEEYMLASSSHSPSSLQAAAEAAAKVNAMLIAKGKLKPSQLSNTQQVKPKAAQGQNNLEMAEVEINDVPINCRNLLTRGSTQDEISKMSGAAVSTRGRFMTQEDRMYGAPGDRPLYLCVQGPTQESVDKAVFRIRDIIANSCRNKVPKYAPRLPGAVVPSLRPRLPVIEGPGPMAAPPPLMSINTQPAGIPLVQDKIFIGLEHAPPNFDAKNKLLGPMGSFLQHIQAETGAKVSLHGRGSGFIEPTTGRETFEPMHVLIQHPTPLGAQHAKELASNLIQTVQQDYAQFQQALAAMPGTISTGTATVITGIHQTAGPPPVAASWSVAQPQQIATGIPNVGPVTVTPAGEVQTVISGAYSQPVPQTVLVNTSIPPPNYAPTHPQTSTPLSLPFGNSVGLGQLGSTITFSQAPTQLVQTVPSHISLQGAGPPQLSLQGQPPPGSVSQLTAVPGGPIMSVPGGPIVSVTGLQPQATQPGIVHVSGLQQATLQTVATQMPISHPGLFSEPPPIVQTVQQLTGPPQAGQPQLTQLAQPPPGSLHQPVVTLQPGQVTLANTGQPQVLQQLTQLQPPQMQQALPGGLAPVQGPPLGPGAPPSVCMAGPSGQTYYKQYLHSAGETETVVTTSIIPRKEDTGRPHKRRFTEEKQEDKLPDNLFGYEHGPPHLASMVAGKSVRSTSQVYGTNPLDGTDNDRPDGEALMTAANSALGSGTNPSNAVTDKQLMPPPMPPFSLIGNEGPVQKKAKGTLNTVTGQDMNNTEIVQNEESITQSQLQQQQQQQQQQYNNKLGVYSQDTVATSLAQVPGQQIVVSESNQAQLVSVAGQSLASGNYTFTSPAVAHLGTELAGRPSDTTPVSSQQISSPVVTGQSVNPALSYQVTVSQYEHKYTQPAALQVSAQGVSGGVTPSLTTQTDTVTGLNQPSTVGLGTSMLSVTHDSKPILSSSVQPNPSILTEPPPPPPPQQQNNITYTDQKSYPQTSIASALPPPPPPPPEHDQFGGYHNSNPNADPYFNGPPPGPPRPANHDLYYNRGPPPHQLNYPPPGPGMGPQGPGMGPGPPFGPGPGPYGPPQYHGPPPYWN